MASSENSESPIIELPDLGKLKGSVGQTFWNKKTIYQFPSIKYGKTTKPPNRFKAPQPETAWKGIRDVTRTRPICPNDCNIDRLFLDKGVEGDIEDCLYLSVFSANLSGSAPVILFVKGSGYFEDNNDYLPDFLLDYDVVLVIPTYRTGILGFLSTLTEDIPGNAGIADVNLALQWVKTNIKHFGGDPNLVTVFGHDFGAVITQVLALEQRIYIPDDDDEELPFQRAIYSSGGLEAPWAVQQDPIEHARQVFQHSGYGLVHGTEEILALPLKEQIQKINDFLKNGNMREILYDIFGYKYQSGPYEPTHYGLSKVVYDDQLGFLRPMGTGFWLREIPSMVGVTKNDGTYAFGKAYDIVTNRLDTEYAEANQSGLTLRYITRFLGINQSSGSLENAYSKQLFTQEDIESGKFENMLHGYIDFCGAVMYKAPALCVAQKNIGNTKNLPFLYTFDYQGSSECASFGTSEDPFKLGVYHSNELLYLMPTAKFLAKITPEEQKIAKTMCQLWASFAKTGKPLADDVKVWNRMTRSVGPVLHIDQKCFETDDFRDEFAATVRDHRNGKSLFVKKDENKPDK